VTQETALLARTEAAPEHWVTAVTRVGRDLEEELADPAALRAITEALAEVAIETNAQMVTGASALGNQLAGVLAAGDHPSLQLWARNGAHGTVLVIEGVLASGVQMARTARRAREAGAERVVGAAVLAESSGLEMCRGDMADEVRALRELVLAP
jgi:adenine/guanine phosphoribosyltransferase-like PRPP-binding protein